MLKFPILGFIHDIIAWIFMGLFMSMLNKNKWMDSRECMGAIWAAGSLAPAATAYVFGNDIYKDGETQMMMTDLGNKFWSLFVVSIALNFYFGGKGISIINLSIKILKMPIIMSFLSAMIFIGLGIDVERDMKITGKFLAALKAIANPFIMVFIGMKVQIPNMNELQIFTPIFARRAFSLYFMAITQIILKLEKSEFMTGVVFFSAADSIWPYVHLMSIYDDEEIEKLIDADFMLNKVAIDYALAVFINMIFTTFQFEKERCFIYATFFLLKALGLAYFNSRNYHLELLEKNKELDIELAIEKDNINSTL